MALGVFAAVATGQAPYSTAGRVGYIVRSLQAIQQASPTVLDQAYTYLVAMDQGACNSQSARLRSSCLITAARRFCRTGGASEGKRCPLFMDVISSNVLAERELISESQRYEMMRRSKDLREELLRHLGHIQGNLAVQLWMFERTARREFHGRLDRFCLQTADKSGLPWQTCASMLVWFLGRNA
jgi:hypothetical protein